VFADVWNVIPGSPGARKSLQLLHGCRGYPMSLAPATIDSPTVTRQLSHGAGPNVTLPSANLTVLETPAALLHMNDVA